MIAYAFGGAGVAVDESGVGSPWLGRLEGELGTEADLFVHGGLDASGDGAHMWGELADVGAVGAAVGVFGGVFVMFFGGGDVDAGGMGTRDGAGEELELGTGEVR